MLYFCLGFVFGVCLAVPLTLRFSRYVIAKMVRFGRLQRGPNFNAPPLPGEFQSRREKA